MKRYRHNKTGSIYVEIGRGLHTETQESMVVYRRENDEEFIWIRPAVMFDGYIEDGRRRFEPIE